jgi:hypothetical protein
LTLQVRTVRPSLLDLRFCGDAWIVQSSEGTPAIYLGDFCLTPVETNGVDLPSLNRMFDAMRHRRPRTRAGKAPKSK